VSVSINTFIPFSIRNNIYCKLSDSNTEHVTYFSNSVGDSHFIICNFTTETSGLNNVSLWYKDSYHKFQISTNNLELVFATPRSIYTFSPPAIKQNRTTKMSVSTFFSTFNVNYGLDVKYYCEYGYNDTSGTFSNASIVSDGVFQCDVILLAEGKAFMKIWMYVKNLIKLISPNELFNVVNSNFFEPAYATTFGGEKMKILDYSDAITTVKFTNPTIANKYGFNCSINGTNLSCLTPKISTADVSAFSSYDLQFSNNQSISTRFVLYGNISCIYQIEKRQIAAFNPKVISATQGEFFTNLTLSNLTTLAEGKLYVVLAKFTEQDKRYDIGGVSNVLEISKLSMSSLKKGIYPMELFYFNPYSFEIRSMFSISSFVNITFTGTSTIELISSNDMFYVNDVNTITIKFSSMNNFYFNDVQKQSIKCKLGTQVLTTNSNGNDEFTCFFSSNIPKDVSLSMVYQNEDAYNHEILLSVTLFKSPL
jgi:hypothetical protein